MKSATKSRPKVRVRNPGERRQFLVTMSTDVIKAIKQAGLEDDRPAWTIIEEAAKDWLSRRKEVRRGRGPSE